MYYNYNGMVPMQDLMYPVEYHNRYSYLYPNIEPIMQNGICPGRCPDMKPGYGMYPDEMYPEYGRCPDMSPGYGRCPGVSPDYGMYPDIDRPGRCPGMYPEPYPDMVDEEMMYPLMYPDIYYRIYPYVHRVCDRMDNPYNYYPSEAQVESMVDECYDICVEAMPDLYDYAGIQAEDKAETTENKAETAEDKAEIAQRGRRRRPILRDLIAIILISELFRRRRRNRFGF